MQDTQKEEFRLSNEDMRCRHTETLAQCPVMFVHNLRHYSCLVSGYHYSAITRAMSNTVGGHCRRVGLQNFASARTLRQGATSPACLV